MKVDLTGYRAEGTVDTYEAELASSGITVGPAGPGDILPLLAFLEAQFPRWKGEAASVLSDRFGGGSRSVTMQVAEHNGTIIGYAQSRSERFGPFGVSDTYRGRGVGGVLLSRTLQAMRTQGFHCGWFLWTSDRTAKLYQQHGFREVRRFAFMTKTISPADP